MVFTRIRVYNIEKLSEWSVGCVDGMLYIFVSTRVVLGTVHSACVELLLLVDCAVLLVLVLVCEGMDFESVG
jgi:hypothetical protein